MSAILKALKKLEKETVANAGAPLSEDTGNQRRKQTKSMIIPGLMVLILCILTGVGVMFFVRKHSAPESTAAFLKDQKLVKTYTQQMPADLPVSVHAPDSFKTVDPVKSPDVINRADPFSPIMATPDVQPDAEDEKIQPVKENENPAAPLQPDTSVRVAPISSLPDHTIAGRPIASKSEPLVDRIEDAAIQLQAISWSADADKRMAIINGKICREKDPVAGYVVQAIHSGEVILSKGSVKGRLVFKIR